eukprot:83929_1
MALLRLCKHSHLASPYLRCNRSCMQLITCRKEHSSSKGIPKEIASHIAQLKSIASETNKAYILPQNNNLNKQKHNKRKAKNQYIDKYSFNYHQTKTAQKQIKHKEKLGKILHTMQSKSLPISQGRVIETAPSHFEISTSPNQLFNNNHESLRLPPNLQDVLSKFTENSSQSHTQKPSIPIPRIKLDETFNNKSLLNNDTLPSIEDTCIDSEDARLEQAALQKTLTKHNSEIETPKSMKAQPDLHEKIETKRRELMNGKREHFYIKNGQRTFGDIGVSDILSEKLKLLGFKCPSHIQSLFIKQYHALESNSHSLIMGAETGSGKTLAFVIPIIDEMIEEYIAMDIIRFNTSDSNADNTQKLRSFDSEMTLKNMILNRDKMPFLKYPKCVIIEPSAELCTQIRGVIQSLARSFGIRVECWTEHHLPPPMPCLFDYLYSHYDDDRHSTKHMTSSPEILVVTPSVLKHVFDSRFALRLNHLVFDEADIMLTHQAGAGHWCHVEQILRALQKYQKDKLLSGFNSNLHRFKPCLYIFTGATLANKRVQVFLGRYGQRTKKQRETHLPEPSMKLFKKAIWVESNGQHRYSANLTQKWLFVRDNQEKQELLLRSLHRHPAQKNRYKKETQSFPPLQQTVIFCNSKRSVEDVEKFLKFHHIPCAAIHEALDYEERERILHQFYNDKECPILICTDMMSRGYDFGCNVECVIQCDFAKTPDVHYNRVGRTARAGTKGLAVNLYMSNNSDLVKELIDISKGNQRIDKLFKVKKINRMTKRNKKKLKKMGIEPPPNMKQQIEKLGVKPRKKEREFRFYSVQQKTERDPDKRKSKKQLQLNNEDNVDEIDNDEPFDFDKFLVNTQHVTDA